MKAVCKATFVRDNEKCSAFAKKIQERLGFKLKLTQCQEKSHSWIAKFSFDHSELEGDYYVTVSYDTEYECFACMFSMINVDQFSPLHVNFFSFQCVI